MWAGPKSRMGEKRIDTYKETVCNDTLIEYFSNYSSIKAYSLILRLHIHILFNYIDVNLTNYKVDRIDTHDFITTTAHQLHDLVDQ